ncbi:BZ3500_MvSof-1268-A1-R1_Chr2-1g04607 [Microbotryum saponariae]|uniref:BZ3500_MvSof-1268-A1-R1_Chr2-1g04607 protein n=1 Tax=Microbotryum saponariae TaxID=289078 RepID=A0A2X0KHM0_9BASI|nr:BZ3500_MvSof-1268-A1-R1_Chr2-1g04607 [Microbotryum saponariae]SCZ92127.1 BZ3501_MvSof-1269-A2-R1_Chr2-1g04263 [Microbotryum saponariae]
MPELVTVACNAELDDCNLLQLLRHLQRARALRLLFACFYPVISAIESQYLRTIEVSPQRSNLDDVLSFASTTSDSRSSRRTEHAQYVYSGPLLRNSAVSALDDVVVKCSLEQLVRSNINFSMDLVRELCRAHHVEGYSRRNPLVKDTSSNACLNGYVFRRQVLVRTLCGWGSNDDVAESRDSRLVAV